MAAFRCVGRSTWYEAEVEDYITKRLSAQLPVTSSDSTVLLFFDGPKLAAVTEHQPLELGASNGRHLGTQLMVVALATPYQGTVVSELPLSQFVLRATMQDCMGAFSREPLFLAYAAEENARSRRLLIRSGFRATTIRELTGGDNRQHQYVEHLHP